MFITVLLQIAEKTGKKGNFCSYLLDKANVLMYNVFVNKSP